MEKYSFDELKMMYESTEKVTDRRLGTNKTNYSINIAIVVAIGVIWQWAIKNPDYFFSGLLLVIIISGVASVFCSLWIGQIRDFKKLNQAKFEVINEMSRNLTFDSQISESGIKSYIPFDKEWEKLSAINALQEAQKNNVIALKSTNTEYFIPKAFRLIFVLFCIISFLTIILNPTETWEGIQFLLHLKKV